MIDLDDLLEDEKKPQRSPLSLPKIEKVVDKEQPLQRKPMRTDKFVYGSKTYSFNDIDLGCDPHANDKNGWDLALAKKLIPAVLRDEAVQRAREGKPFEKGEKSYSAHFMEKYKERFSQPYEVVSLNEVVSLIRKEAANARSEIAKGVKEKIQKEALSKYPVPERRTKKKRAMAKEKSPEIGVLEERLQLLSRDKITKAFKLEYEIVKKRKNAKANVPSLPVLDKCALKRFPIPAMPEPLNPKKGLIYSSFQHERHSLKFQIEALNRPTSYTESKLKYPVAQLVVSLPERINVSEDQAIWMCHRHMARMGIDPTQHTYFIYKHTNTEFEHYHMVYNRVRLDGGVHHLPGANQVCHLESSLQDVDFGQNIQIAALTGRDKLSRIVQSRLANGTHCAELRYYKKPTVEVPVVGEECYDRIEKVGECSLQTAGGGFVKHQLFHNANWLVRHVLK